MMKKEVMNKPINFIANGLHLYSDWKAPKEIDPVVEYRRLLTASNKVDTLTNRYYLALNRPSAYFGLVD